MKFAPIAALAAGLSATAMFAAPLALAQNQPQAQSQAWLSVSEIDRRLSAQGFRVLEIERDDGRYEVTALDANNQCRELKVDPRSGEIVRNEADDDCRDH